MDCTSGKGLEPWGNWALSRADETGAAVAAGLPGTAEGTVLRVQA